MKCLNINNPQIQSELNKLTSILGDANAAYAVLALNNGYGLDKAPNGQDSKLLQDIREALISDNKSLTQEDLIKKTYLKKALCYTPSFLEWFGDWVDDPDNASKVVDENGEPMVVYHGSDKYGFDEFKPTDYRRRASYFSTDPLTALTYVSYHTIEVDEAANVPIGTYKELLKTKQSLEHQLKKLPNDQQLKAQLDDVEKKISSIINPTHPNLKYIYPVFISSKNPKRLNAQGQNWRNFNPDQYEYLLEQHDGIIIDNFIDAGHRGPVPGAQTTIAVKDPNQIKSAIGNNGDFSKSNNIYEEHEYKRVSRQTDNRLLTLYTETKNLSFEDKWIKIIDEIIYPSPYKDVANLLTSFSSKGNRFLSKINIELVDHLNYIGDRAIASREVFKGKRAYYDASNSTIYIDIRGEYNNGDSASVLMHEIMHGVTVSRIIENEELKNKFSKILTQFKKYNPSYYLSFEKHNLEEFIADIWTNPEIIQRLKDTPATKNTKITLWDRVVKFFQSVLFGDIPDGSLFQEASALMVELLESNPTDKKLKDRYYENFNLSQDTKDILALQQYQYSIEGLTPEEIQDRQRAYLSQDPDEVQRVRKFLELIQVRQAQLHTFNKDFGEEQYINGIFDWNSYLLGIDLRKDITENQDLSAFSPIVDYTVDPAEIIMPKLYKTQFKLGTKDIADIDLNFFKRANPFYKSDLKSEEIPVDYLVRGHNFAYNIVVQDTLQFDHVNWKPITPRIKDGWRLDNSGNRMYQVPEDCKSALYVNSKGQETLVILNESLTDNYVKTIIETTNNRVSVHPFFENIAPTKSKLLDVVKWNHITTINGALKNLSRQVDQMEESQIREILNDLYIKRERQYKNDLANTLYNSFIKTLQLVSVRIPTQDFQSIMATKVVGLTNDDSNNVFVTRWQFWLQGSKQYYL